MKKHSLGILLSWEQKDTVHTEFKVTSSIPPWLLLVIGVLAIAAVAAIILMKKKKAGSVNNIETTGVIDAASK